ncbi:MAG: DUF2339 domain-containing protein [Methylobacteriaceae bacterium]|nr:DUF2339 domain-containing protein [Methylobacteriaceae bacterium]
MIALLTLAGLLIAVSGPVAFFMALKSRERLAAAERRIAELEARPIGAARVAPPLPGAAPEPPVAAEEQAPSVEPSPVPTPPPVPPTEAAPGPASAWDGFSWPGAPASANENAADQVAAAPARSLEERLGASWTVWVGGVALALGGLLLVRYSIEQGYFGPGARTVLGLIFGALLAAAGEVLRRREKAGTPSQIPAVLTAAGTVALFGAIYAAHGLYGFIGPAPAFVALGVIAVAAIFAAALHGPALAGLGLVGAFAAPLLVSSAQPNPWPVVLYLAAATGAAYALSRIRRWLWLAAAAAVGAGLWALVMAAQGSTNFFHAALVQTIVSAALAATFLAFLPHLATSDEEAVFDPVASVILGAFGVVGFVVAFHGFETGALSTTPVIMLGILVAGLAAIGATAPPAAAVTPVAGALAAAILWIWTGDSLKPIHLSTVATLHEPLLSGLFTAFAAVSAVVVAGFSARKLATAPRLPMVLSGCYAGAAAVAPLAILAIVYLRLARSEASPPFALLAGGLAAVFVVLAQYFRRGDGPDADPATKIALGAFATAALAALALGFVFVFDKGVLTVALSVAALAAAYVATRLDLAALRYAVAAMGFVVLGRLAWEPRIVGEALGTTPILNWLLFGYGVPALAFGLAARQMRLAGGEDLPVRVAQSLTILFSGLLVFFETRHALNGGDAYALTSSLIEQGLFATSALLFAIVLTRLDLRRASPVFNIASMVFGAIALAISAAGLAAVQNPFLECRAVEGGTFFNALMLAYLLPAVLAAVLMRMSRGSRPQWYVNAAGVLSLALLFLYACLQTRRFFHGAVMCESQGAEDVEIWAYSAVWLALGALLLLYGVWRRMQGARIASGLFVLAATLKIFLYDMSGLEGLMRALSFIGLGLVLIGIGLLYQKLVFARRPPAGGDAPDVV